MTEKWNKYSYLNTENNCLIEVTHLEGTEEKLILNPLNNSPYLLLSVEDATIKEHPTNERNTMEQTTTVPETYNPNLLVTYKKIAGTYAAPEAPEYITDKVVDIEWALDGARRSEARANSLNSKIEEIQSFMTEDNWYNPNTEASEILSELERILDFNPVKQIEFTGTIRFSGTIEVPLNESEDFDLFYHLQDNLTLDSYDGNTSIDSYEVENVDQE